MLLPHGDVHKFSFQLSLYLQNIKVQNSSPRSYCWTSPRVWICNPTFDLFVLSLLGEKNLQCPHFTNWNFFCNICILPTLYSLTPPILDFDTSHYVVVMTQVNDPLPAILTSLGNIITREASDIISLKMATSANTKNSPAPIATCPHGKLYLRTSSIFNQHTWRLTAQETQFPYFTKMRWTLWPWR